MGRHRPQVGGYRQGPSMAGVGDAIFMGIDSAGVGTEWPGTLRPDACGAVPSHRGRGGQIGGPAIPSGHVRHLPDRGAARQS